MLLLQCTGVLSHVLPKLHYMYCAETLVLSVTLFLNKYEYTGSTWDFLSHNGTRKTNAAALRTQSPPNKKGQTTVCPFQTVCQGKFWVAVIQDRIQWNLSVRRKVGNFLNMWAANDFCIFRTCPCADEPLECQRHAYLRRHMHACMHAPSSEAGWVSVKGQCCGSSERSPQTACSSSGPATRGCSNR